MIRLGIRVRAADAEIAFARLEPVLEGGLEEIDAGGTVELALYGDQLPSEAEVRALGGDTIVGLTREPVADGWERAWHAHLGRVVAGGLAVRPPWVAGEADDLVIDPGPSFGVAGHPTTRLCLDLLADFAAGGAGERHGGAAGGGAAAVGRGAAGAAAERSAAPGAGGRPSRALADWGCGSGILAIAAARLGFAPVIAVEVDPAAAEVARANAAANGVAVEVVTGDVTRGAPWAPTVVANLTLPLLEAAAAVALAPPSGTLLVASGVLAADADTAIAAWAPLGFVERERREAGGWAAVVLERA